MEPLTCFLVNTLHFKSVKYISWSCNSSTDLSWGEYSGTPLMWTPRGHAKVAVLSGCLLLLFLMLHEHWLVPSRLHTVHKESAGRDGYRERECKVRWKGRKPLLPSHHPLLPYLVCNSSFAAGYMKTTGDESGTNILTKSHQKWDI